MRRILIALIAVFALAALVPSVALAARPAPKVDAFAYEGVFGDIVGGGQTYGVWNVPDGATDTVFSLQLAALTTKDLSALEIADDGPNYWDTLPGLWSGWGLGVTAKAHGKVTLLNNLTTTEYTADLDNGLRIYLRIRADGGMLTSGETVTLTIRYSDTTWTQLTTTVP